MAKVCTDCQAEIVTGPENPCKVTNGKTTFIEYRCEECARQFGMALWDADERGPYPLMPVSLPGRA